MEFPVNREINLDRVYCNRIVPPVTHKICFGRNYTVFHSHNLIKSVWDIELGLVCHSSS
jgi:hypothetical protein